MEPLETAYLIGLDVVVDSLETLYEGFHNHRFRCRPFKKKDLRRKIGEKKWKGILCVLSQLIYLKYSILSVNYSWRCREKFYSSIYLCSSFALISIEFIPNKGRKSL